MSRRSKAPAVQAPALLLGAGPFEVSETLKFRGNPASNINCGVGLPRRQESPGRFPMTISSEHHGYGTDRVAERLAIVAIVISGVAATVIWFYLLW